MPPDCPSPCSPLLLCAQSANQLSRAALSAAAQQQEDLFRQAMESSLDRYQAILASLQLAPAAQRGAPPRVPLRLYLRTDAGGRLSGGEAGAFMPCGGKVACISAGQAVC